MKFLPSCVPHTFGGFPIGFKIMILDCVIGRRRIAIQPSPSSLAQTHYLKAYNILYRFWTALSAVGVLQYSLLPLSLPNRYASDHLIVSVYRVPQTQGLGNADDLLYFKCPKKKTDAMSCERLQKKHAPDFTFTPNFGCAQGMSYKGDIFLIDYLPKSMIKYYSKLIGLIREPRRLSFDPTFQLGQNHVCPQNIRILSGFSFA